MSLLDSCVTAHAHGVADGVCLPIAHETQLGHCQKQATGRLLTLQNLREREVCEPCFGWDVQGPSSPGTMSYSPTGSGCINRGTDLGAGKHHSQQPGGPGAALPGSVQCTWL